jgi:hypothetical protein
MGEPRPPREDLAEILSIQPEGEGAFTARLEGFWGSSLRGRPLPLPPNPLHA